MNAYKMFKTDQNLATQGIWLDYGGFKILVAYAGETNTNYRRVLASKMRPYLRQLKMGTLSDEKAHALYTEVYAESVILGWEGMEDEEGKKLPFTKENVIKVMNDLPALFRDIEAQAQELSLFRAGEKAEIEKN